MDGCSPDDPNRLNTPEDLIELLRSVGFLPLFSNGIRGFSVEEHVPASNWWTGEYSDPWTWRHVLSSHLDLILPTVSSSGEKRASYIKTGSLCLPTIAEMATTSTPYGDVHVPMILSSHGYLYAMDFFIFRTTAPKMS